MDDHVDLAAVTSQGFVDGVIHHLENHVVQTGAVVGIADVHARALTYGVQAFEYLDGGCVVSIFVIRHGWLDSFGEARIIHVAPMLALY